jgi:hypothetical protein
LQGTEKEPVATWKINKIIVLKMGRLHPFKIDYFFVAYLRSRVAMRRGGKVHG